MLRTYKDHRYGADALRVHTVMTGTAGKSQNRQPQCLTADLQLLLQASITYRRRQLPS